MRLLIDTNIVLDVMLNRAPFCDAAVDVLNLASVQGVEEYVSASAITDIYYIAYRQIRDREIVKNLIKRLLNIVSVAGVTEREIEKALESGWSDFEDAVQHAVASIHDFDGIVTRNAADYRQSEVDIWTPQQIVAKLKSE